MKKNTVHRRNVLPFPVLLLLPWLNGCVKMSTVVSVTSSGNGRIVESIAIREDMIQQLIAVMGGITDVPEAQPKVTEDDFFPLEQFRRKVNEYGVAVSCVGVKKTREGGFLRMTAEYAFRDIAKLRLPTKQTSTIEFSKPTSSPAQSDTPICFSLYRNIAGGYSELTIHMPPPAPLKRESQKKEPSFSPESPVPGSPEAPQGQALLALMKDFEINMAIECGKEIIASNATCQENNRVILVYLSLAKLLENPQKLEGLQEMKTQPQTLEEVMQLFKGIEGMRFELQPRVSVKYR